MLSALDSIAQATITLVWLVFCCWAVLIYGGWVIFGLWKSFTWYIFFFLLLRCLAVGCWLLSVDCRQSYYTLAPIPLCFSVHSDFIHREVLFDSNCKSMPSMTLHCDPINIPNSRPFVGCMYNSMAIYTQSTSSKPIIQKTTKLLSNVGAREAGAAGIVVDRLAGDVEA